MQGIREMGVAGLGLPKDLEQWRQRVQWVAEHVTPSPVPDLTHNVLMAGLETWLAPHLMGCRSKAQLQSLNWSVILRSAGLHRPGRRVKLCLVLHSCLLGVQCFAMFCISVAAVRGRRAACRSLLSWEQQQEVESLAPEKWQVGGWRFVYGTTWPFTLRCPPFVYRGEQQLQPPLCLPVMQTPGGSKLSIDYSHHPPLLKVGSDCFGSFL